MTALYKAGEALGFNAQQIESLLFFWNLPHLAQDPQHVESVLRSRLFLSEDLIKQFIEALNNFNQSNDVSAFCTQLWTEHNALEALALLTYFQQLYFTKTTIAENTTQLSQFTSENTHLIQQLADSSFNMIRERKLVDKADITLLIGGKSKTCGLYWQQFLNAGPHAGKAYVFLSPRILVNDRADNMFGAHISYLKDHYLDRYNNFMSRIFPDTFKPIDKPTEGLAMFESFHAKSGIRFENAYERHELRPFFTGSEDSDAFYQCALSFGVQNQELTNGSMVAICSVQPYLDYYQIQFDVIRNQLAESLQSHSQVLKSLECRAFGTAGISQAHIIAQRLAVMLDKRYSEAAKKLQISLGIANAEPLPAICLRTQYSSQTPLVFVCSSFGDSALAKDTIQFISEKSSRPCSIIALNDNITDSLHVFSQDRENVELITSIENQSIQACTASQIVNFIETRNFSNAFIGMPSVSGDDKALQVALGLNIPVTFSCDFMFNPPGEHQVWQYQDRLKDKKNIHFAVPLPTISLFNGHPNRHVVGHRSLYSPSNPISASDQAILRSQLIETGSHLAVVSGTTQAPGIDKDFLEALLSVLPNYPNIQLRYSIHPGIRQNMHEYIQELINVANRLDSNSQFKIILTPLILEKLTQEQKDSLMQSRWIIICNITGAQAQSCADGFCQAAPGELANMSALNGKPTFTTGDSLLPNKWFAGNIANFFTAISSNASTSGHSLGELNLHEDHDVRDAMAKLMLRIG